MTLNGRNFLGLKVPDAGTENTGKANIKSFGSNILQALIVLQSQSHVQKYCVQPKAEQGVRDYIHVAYLANGHMAALRKLSDPEIGCEVYNLGTGKGSCFGDGGSV